MIRVLVRVLPVSLVIGPHDIAVAETEIDGDDGQWSPQSLRIEIGADLPLQLKKEALLHETLHAIWDQLDLPAKHEEAIITRLAPALLALCRFNPELKDVLFTPA